MSTAILLWLLLGPRIELASTAGTSVRVEDFLLLVSALWVLRAPLRERRATGLLRGVAVVVLVSLFSAAVAITAGRVSALASVAYSIRPAEYFVVYLLAADVEKRNPGRLSRIAAIGIAVNAVMAVLQGVFGLSLGQSRFDSSRAAGLTSGPYELAVISLALAVYFISRHQRLSATLAVLCVALSASRVSAISLVMLGVLATAHSMSGRAAEVDELGRHRKALQAVSLLVLLSLFVTLAQASGAYRQLPWIGSRLASTSLLDSADRARQITAAVPPILTSSEYTSIATTPSLIPVGARDSEDASSSIRFFKWYLLIRTVGEQGSWMWGLGPSFASSAVDGNYVRAWAETGLLGLLAWIALLRRMSAGRMKWLQYVVLAYALNAVFIDILVAMRPMLWLWTLLALADAAPPLRANTPASDERCHRPRE